MGNQSHRWPHLVHHGQTHYRVTQTSMRTYPKVDPAKCIEELERENSGLKRAVVDPQPGSGRTVH